MRNTRLPADPDSEAAAFSAGMGMLSRREFSVLQVRQRLSRKGYAPSAVDAALERLLASGALDDRRVAHAAARTHAQVKHHGRERVARELAALGLSREVVAEALADVFGALDERALVEAALDRRLRRPVDLRDPAARRRVFAALVRQGFSPDVISRALRARSHTGDE